MASEGKEYDIEEDSSLGIFVNDISFIFVINACVHTGIDVKERMAKQRQLLNARLGLDVVSNIGLDMTELFTNEDFSVHTELQDTQAKCDFNIKVSRIWVCFS